MKPLPRVLLPTLQCQSPCFHHCDRTAVQRCAASPAPPIAGGALVGPVALHCQCRHSSRSDLLRMQFPALIVNQTYGVTISATTCKTAVIPGALFTTTEPTPSTDTRQTFAHAPPTVRADTPAYTDAHHFADHKVSLRPAEVTRKTSQQKTSILMRFRHAPGRHYLAPNQPRRRKLFTEGSIRPKWLQRKCTTSLGTPLE